MVAALRTTSAASHPAPRTAPPRAAAAAPRTPTRRHLLAAALATAPSLLPPHPALAASLKSRLDSHDAAQLSKPYALSIPTELTYPPWLEGDWTAASSFAGYELPAKDKIERVPGNSKRSSQVGLSDLSMTLDLNSVALTFSFTYGSEDPPRSALRRLAAERRWTTSVPRVAASEDIAQARVARRRRCRCRS